MFGGTFERDRSRYLLKKSATPTCATRSQPNWVWIVAASSETIDALMRSFPIALLLVVLACGGDDGDTVDDPDAGDGDGGVTLDAGATPTQTRVTGTMDGAQFTMQFALLEWDLPQAPLLCLSSREFSDSIPECNAGDDTRYVFVTRLDMEGAAISVGQVDNVVQSSTVDSMLCVDNDGGTLIVHHYDPANEQIAISLELECDDGPLMGTVVLP